jgi:hypothetical protein
MKWVRLPQWVLNHLPKEFIMTIDEAVKKLQENLDGSEDHGIFNVRHDGKEIVVDVNFVYRVNDVPKEFEGFKVVTGQGRGRVSCW